MAEPDKHEREIAALRDRTSALSAAVLRVTASLDESTVLQEIVDSACELTNARYGVITTIDGSGPPRDFVTSGFTPEEHLEMESWLPDGPLLFDHLRELSAPLRLADLPSYVRSLGFSADLMPAKTFQGTPMRHRGAHVGSFFLAGKRGGREFSAEDEDVLVLFASQAATAIANARTHRNEQRSRASLEALVETSPVGVVVLDVSTGAPTTFNREARRLVENLVAAGRPSEELIEVPHLPVRRRPRSPDVPPDPRRARAARRGGPALGCRRPRREGARQRDDDPLRGRRTRVHGRHVCRISRTWTSWSG